MANPIDPAPIPRPHPSRRLTRFATILLATIVAVPTLAFAWVRWNAAGHLFAETDAPSAEVVMVLGTGLSPDRTTPKPILRGRLDTAAALVRAGKAKVILVSGDARGASGDEIAAMTTYLTGRHGIEPHQIVADGYGLDTYDSCARASQVYGVRRMLVVTQSYHLSRAVTLCRHLRVEVDGVRAGCPDCSRWTLAGKYLRDFAASSKAAWDAVWGRSPAVMSPPDPAVRDALSR